MEFYFEDSVWIEEDDLEEMVSRVKAGEKFDNVYNNIASCWNGPSYYNSDLITDDVEKEVMKRIARNP